MKNKGFKKNDKQGEGYFACPEEFRLAIGMEGITENGMGIYPGGSYDKVYFCNENVQDVSNYEKIKGCTMLLRSAGIKFSFYEIPELEKVALVIVLQTQGYEEAVKGFELLENDMRGNLYTFGITIYPLDSEERLSLMHHLVMMDVKNARIDVSSYLTKTSGWLQDYKFLHYEEQDELMRSKERCCRTMYVRRVPTEHAAEIYRRIKGNKSCTLLVSVYEPISDQMVVENLERNYIGYESVLSGLRRRKRGIGKVSENKDERRYVYAGVYFVLAAESEELLKEVEVRLQEEIVAFDCEISGFDFYQKDTWKLLVFLRPWYVRQTMLLQSGCIVAMNPFYKEERSVDSEEVGAKAELLAAFDAMTEGGTVCR